MGSPSDRRPMRARLRRELIASSRPSPSSSAASGARSQPDRAAFVAALALGLTTPADWPQWSAPSGRLEVFPGCSRQSPPIQPPPRAGEPRRSSLAISSKAARSSRPVRFLGPPCMRPSPDPTGPPLHWRRPRRKSRHDRAGLRLLPRGWSHHGGITRSLRRSYPRGRSSSTWAQC